jgi:hypothetical protein
MNAHLQYMGSNEGLRVEGVVLPSCCISIGTMQPLKPEMGVFTP